MATTAIRLQDVLVHRFHGADVGNIQQSVGGRVGGSFTSPDFDGVAFRDRVERVWNVIREELGSDSTNVGAIMPLDSQGRQ